MALDSLESILIFPFENMVVAGCIVVYTDDWAFCRCRKCLLGKLISRGSFDGPKHSLLVLLALNRWRQRQRRHINTTGRRLDRKFESFLGLKCNKTRMCFSVRYVVEGWANRKKVLRGASVSSLSSSSYLAELVLESDPQRGDVEKQ